MTGLVLQARLDSSRLSRKALLPLGSQPMIVRVMEALRQVRSELYILACPQDCVATFAPLAQEAGFLLCAGSKEDVLSRYCDAIRLYKLDRIIRATGDNPFVFADAADLINAEALALGADYAGYSALPYGAGVESVAAEALLCAEREVVLKSDREHVCPYLYRHPQHFLVHRPLAPVCWRAPHLRITVDTAEDYTQAQKLYAALPEEPQQRYRGECIIKVLELLPS
ncbi:MAG: NTP transferase domain-containing protein [Spirochaetaceae bacterium]|jgi:spore coat polysaccharide biosynthesis protein SpsF|nr:NTP transferase domain-containing protein [Spirochaetaceae bacterium]